MKVLTGDVAILNDSYPLATQVTLRLATPEDSLCNCGAGATFVLLKADVAKHAPHLPNLEDRISHAWLHVYQGVCGNHLAMAVRDISGEVAIRPR